MGISYGSQWTIQTNTLRSSPSYTPKILLQLESSGYEDLVQNRGHKIYIGGVNVLDSTSPRSYRVSRLTYSNGWNYSSSNGYDVYGLVSEANAMLAYLQTFNTGDMLILNTYDEPLNNRSVFQTELKNNFYAQLQDSPVWDYRCSYQLIAVKGKGVIYESIKPRVSAVGIHTSMWLG